MTSLVKSSLNRSRTTLTSRSGSSYRATGDPEPEAVRLADASAISFHWVARRSTSRPISSSLTPSAAVRMITPDPSGTTSLRMALRRRRSVSGSLREMPVEFPSGT